MGLLVYELNCLFKIIGVETEDSEHNYSKIKTKCIIIETRFNYNCVTINKEISIEIMEKIDNY
jgi:hypothetical protein